ncbi:hypothetical protein [Sphingobium sp. CAP-1]|uniref:hypothetical protein n=1 Tax=Sphingobium sp. CAP-1 TaxID=2676077 RepID=UPI0012BB3F8D|nr:hypothetical protein [Sphingobium sp. CAP-1]QGP79589.1 hypothetical protein GL174_11815 [Sphingobium sp. CAP-1]
MANIITTIRASIAALCLLICASCGQFMGSTIPAEVLATCVATSTGYATIPSSHTVQDLVALLQERSSISWEGGTGRSGIIRLRGVDKLSGKVATMAFELTEQPADSENPACASGMSLINRMEGNGVVATGIETQMVVLGLLEKAPKKATQQSAGPPMRFPPATDAPAPTNAATDQLIDGCYHLDSCAYSKVLNVETVKEQGGDRLLRASIEHGEVSNATGSAEDQQRINWSGAPSTVYAFCSTRSPAIVMSQGSSYLAEEFDFADDGIAGVQQKNANIYQALCHGIYDNSLTDRAASLGYQPLAEEGGRGQFIVASPEALFADN